MNTYKFVMRVEGSAKGTVKAGSKEEAKKLIEEGQWEELEFDPEDIIEIERIVKQDK